MDQPGLDPGAHANALAGLARLNQLSLAAFNLIAPLQRFAAGGSRLSVLDLGCGGGDVTLATIAHCRRRGLELDVLACDLSATALRLATASAKSRGLSRCFQTKALNVLTEPLPADHDVVMSSLFLHHLDDDQAAKLLARMTAAAGRGVIVSDILRSRVGFALALLASRLVTRSAIVHADALASVRQAFTLAEIRALLDAAGVVGRLEWIWPWRFRLEIST